MDVLAVEGVCGLVSWSRSMPADIVVRLVGLDVYPRLIRWGLRMLRVGVDRPTDPTKLGPGES